MLLVNGNFYCSTFNWENVFKISKIKVQKKQEKEKNHCENVLTKKYLKFPV